MSGKDLACSQTSLVCLKRPTGGHRPILTSSVWIKLISRLLLKEAGTPLKDLFKGTQFGVGVPHGGLALHTKAHSRLQHNPTHVAAQLDFQNAFGAMHRKACIDQMEKHISWQEPWFLGTKKPVEQKRDDSPLRRRLI